MRQPSRKRSAEWPAQQMDAKALGSACQRIRSPLKEGVAPAPCARRSVVSRFISFREALRLGRIHLLRLTPQRHLCIHTWQQPRIGVRQVDFDPHRARRRIERCRDAGHGAAECETGQAIGFTSAGKPGRISAALASGTSAKTRTTSSSWQLKSGLVRVEVAACTRSPGLISRDVEQPMPK